MKDLTSKKIHEAFGFVGRVGLEIGALKNAIDEGMRKTSSNEKYAIETHDEQESPNDKYRWVCDAWAVDYTVSQNGKKVRKKDRLGYLYYLFDLSLKSGPAEWLSQAVICVGYVSEGDKAKNMDIDSFQSWKPTLPDESGYRWEVSKDGKSWFWNGHSRDLSKVKDACWVYFVPIGLIRNQVDVDKILVRPPLEIFAGLTTSLKGIPQVIKFSQDGEVA